MWFLKLQRNFIEIILRHGCYPVILLHIFRTPFPTNTVGGLLLEHDSYLVIEWFENNFIKINQAKCNLHALGFKYENVWVKIGKIKNWESKKQTLLGREIDRILSFDGHIVSFCRKTGNKWSVLKRLSNFMCTGKKRVLLKAFVESSLVIKSA